MLQSLNLTEMREMNRDQLIEDYIQTLIENMDYKTMECFVYDAMKENLSTYTDEELLTEVEEYNPELLGLEESP